MADSSPTAACVDEATCPAPPVCEVAPATDGNSVQHDGQHNDTPIAEADTADTGMASNIGSS